MLPGTSYRSEAAIVLPTQPDRWLVFGSLDDIMHSHLLHRSLTRLQIVATGNIGNKMIGRLPFSVLPEWIKTVDSHRLKILHQTALNGVC